MSMPGKKASKAMLQRMAALESKLGASLAARSNRAKLQKNILGMKKRRTNSNPSGPGPSRAKAKSGRLGLGSGVSGATTRRAQVISEDEYIGEVNGSVTFATTQYTVNPGQASVFPWGNKIASLYERYKFRLLEFYFKREVSEFATNGQAGKVILSFDYDASDTPPTTKQQVEDTVPHQDGMPCTPIIKLSVDCATLARNPCKFVRPGAQPANTDIKTYDAGNLYVSTQGNTNASLIGELRVRYVVELTEPVLEPASTVGGVVHFSGTTPTTANNLATATLQSGGTPALTGIVLGTNSIIFPAGIPGNYLVTMSLAGSTSAGEFYMSASTGVSNLLLFAYSGVKDAATQVYSNAGTAAATSSMTSGTFTVATAGGTLTINPATMVGGVAMDLFIVSLPSSVLTTTLSERIDGIEHTLSSGSKLNRLLARMEEFGLLDSSDDDASESSSLVDIEEVPKRQNCIPVGVSVSSPGLTKSKLAAFLGQ
jgi:hypothetical protein